MSKNRTGVESRGESIHIPKDLADKIVVSCIQDLGLSLPYSGRITIISARRAEVVPDSEHVLPGGLQFRIEPRTDGSDMCDPDDWHWVADTAFFCAEASLYIAEICLPCEIAMRDSKGDVVNWWLGLDRPSGDIVAHCVPSCSQPHRHLTLCYRRRVVQIESCMSYDRWDDSPYGGRHA